MSRLGLHGGAPQPAGPGLPAAPRRARDAAIVAFVVGHLALLALSIAVSTSIWFDPLVRVTGGLVNDTLLVNLVGLALVSGVVLGIGRLRPADVGLRWSDLPRALVVLALLWVASQMVAVALAWVSTGSIAPHPLWDRRGQLGVLGLLLAQLLGNALFEEVGYRGFLLRQLELRLGWVTSRRRRLAMAAALSLALFAAMHVPNRLSEGVAGADLARSVLIAVALGALLTLLYLRTGNLLLVVGVHALINAPTLLVASPISHEIVEGLAVLLLVAWPRRASRERMVLQPRTMTAPFVGMLLAGAVALIAAGEPLRVAGAVAPAATDRQAVDRFVASQMDRHRIPGVALALIEDGRVTYATGYGTAGGGRPVTADTPMGIGSISKSFTAVAILQLMEAGRVDLEAPVRTYLPWFAVADDAASRGITLRHLLYHTSGLSEFGYNRVHDPDTSLEQAVRDLRDARPTAPVGTEYQYFSPNYQVLALIIEMVTGQTYGDYVTDNIFVPLRMTRSYASQDEARAAGMAQGHSKLFGFPIARDHPFRQYALGSGYLISTARDLSQFLIAVGNDGAYEGARILSPASVALMKTPLAEPEQPAVGMGWDFAQYHGERWEHAAGGDETFMSEMLLSPEHGRGVVWLMNQQHLLDPAWGQFSAGLTALLLERQPDEGGLSMRVLGLGILVAFLLATAMTVRSFLRLRGWTERSRALSAAALVHTIAPQFLIPALILVAVYRFLGPLLFGTAWSFNIRYVGLYMIPDIALLLFVATVPDLAQGVSMSAAVLVDRVRQSRHRHDVALGAHTPASPSPRRVREG